MKNIRALNLSHRFEQSTPLFQDLSFDLTPGRSFALTGPSGSGKSTLLGLIAGWIQPSAGSLTYREIDRICWVFQSPHGVAQRTALDHVVFPLLTRGLARKAAEIRAHELLKVVGLESRSKTQFKSLSGGEAQRLMFARGIASDPDVLLIDEPTAQLDRLTARDVNKAIEALRSSSLIVVVATHDEQTRRACSDHIDLATAR